MSAQQYSFMAKGENNLPDASEMRFGIVVAEWNSHITDKLLQGAVETLRKNGVGEHSITVMHVPGSFELIYGCSQLTQHGFVDAVIAIGCVIKGDCCLSHGSGLGHPTDY
jgi:6,7-dimethyl-8-ribityllumazine synthase